IDPEWLARMQRTKPAFLCELFSMFLVDEPKRLAALAFCVNAADMEQARYLAHSIKGAAATLGLIPLRDAARELEFAARDGQAEELAKGLARIQAEAETVFAAMRQAMPKA
ncbi:MAG TPA: Hpt domain-containing protein, partial [Humidesulfovibrio sp.]|uniref:Hpt domain-containing protein n=1 Tax=Humidesulfovibrio sp. TaxID=2910988 RepID=UPI002C4A3CF5